MVPTYTHAVVVLPVGVNPELGCNALLLGF